MELEASSIHLPKNVGHWTRPDSPQVINSKNIFEYMNGAGELYLGYRFHHLDVFDYTSQNQDNILVELYFMETSDDEATPEKVFYWLGNPERAMEWQTNVTKYKIIKDTPDKVGTTFTEYIEEKGRGTEMQGVVTDFVPNKKLAFHLEGDYNTVDVDFSLKEKDGITHLTQNADIHFKGMLKVIGIFIKKKIIKQTQRKRTSLILLLIK